MWGKCHAGKRNAIHVWYGVIGITSDIVQMCAEYKAVVKKGGTDGSDAKLC